MDRYRLKHIGYGQYEKHEDPEGDYCKWKDVEKALEKAYDEGFFDACVYPHITKGD